MNLLDSELVVAKLRNEGYELTDDLNQADPSSTTPARSGSMRRTRSTVRSGGSSGSRSASRRCRSACWAAWLRRTRSRSFGALRMSTWSSGPGQLAKVGELLAKAGTKTRAQIAVSRARTAGSLEVIAASFEGYDADREPAHAAQPVSGVRPRHDGVRQVLHLLHRPVGPRARAKPSARR